MRCGGSSSLRALRATAWRVVESQQRISTRKLVDSDAEHGVLEDLIEASKPPQPRGPEWKGLHYLLHSPFRYPPLPHGSRFGSRLERSLWYGSEHLETAFAEVAYYRLLFFEGTTAALLPNRIAKSAFQASLGSDAAVDLTLPPFDGSRAEISSRTEYAASQRLGSEMRAAGVEVVRYASARDPAGRPNLAVFTPAAFARKRPLAAPQTWHCTVTASRDVSFMREEVRGIVKHEFSRGAFLVDGRFPAPAF